MSVSDCESFSDLVKPSPRGFARTLLLGGMFVVAAMTAQNFKSWPHHGADQRRPALLSFIDARPSAPSAYDEEHRMSSAELLNRWDVFVTEASQRFHVPKAWIRAVMRQESGGRTMLTQNKPIISSAGAIGLMQVMPATYDQMAQAHKLGEDPMNPRDNIMAGAAYLRWLHQRYGYPRMFAAYNAGPGRLEQGGRLPAETRAYISGITSTLRTAKGGESLVNFTRPDGQTVKLDPAKVAAIRAPLPGEYAPSVKAVLTVGGRHQAVREDVRLVTAAIRATGGAI
ncbi:MAG: lytic transglycosylase protein [Alphaproteobacteria bacterium]|nr:lytic transglycosylase protein [Alphaproteobacteria bacterium]